MSERHACRLMGLGRTTHRYRARKAERDSELRARLKKLAAKRMRFGYRRLTAMLVREGMPTNHKRLDGNLLLGANVLLQNRSGSGMPVRSIRKRELCSASCPDHRV